ncbi:MAG: NAD(P)H-binding protein [Tetrasphaera sp.]
MRVLIAGASGGTGRAATLLALSAGHTVTAVARRPERLGLQQPRLALVAADARDPGTMSAVVRGHDAVVSTLGIGMRRHPTDVYSAGTRAIVAAMVEQGVSRLIVQSSSALDPRPVAPSHAYRALMALLHRVLAAPYADMRAMEDIVTSSPLAWTLVRAARLTDGGLTGQVRVGTDRGLPDAWSISRADCARWMVDHLDAAPETHRAVISLAS